MHNLPIVDEAVVRALRLEAGKPGNDDKHTQILSLASSRAENVEQFDPEMVRAFFEMSKWCMYERNFRRAAILMEKAWSSILSIFPDNRVKQLEALFVLKESYIRLNDCNSAADALRAALTVMQDCIDRRDTYALTNPPQPPICKIKSKEAATMYKISLAVLALTLGIQQGVFAQSCNLGGAPVGDLRDPIINGSTSSAPFQKANPGAPPPIGDGPTSQPVTPGMPGPGTLLPWVPAIPANTIDTSVSGISLPVDPAVETPPGVLGPALTPVIPAPPSTPGTDPGNLTAPADSFNPAADENINPDGGIPGTGGFCTTIPTLRRGGQDTTQWELRGRNSVLGGLGGDGSQDEVTRLGPMAGFGVPFGVPTGDGLRNSSIDLGGGQRFKAGGSKISTGSSVQQYQESAMRNNPIAALRAQQSYEFGQGFRNMPVTSSKTTDFGLPYFQFSPANENSQKRAQLLLPKAVITNF